MLTLNKGYVGITTTNRTIPKTLPWPSAGYFPYELIPSERWSFAVPGVDISNADVIITMPDGDDIIPDVEYSPQQLRESRYNIIFCKSSKI